MRFTVVNRAWTTSKTPARLIEIVLTSPLNYTDKLPNDCKRIRFTVADHSGFFITIPRRYKLGKSSLVE
jgi:hypothetical protein